MFTFKPGGHGLTASSIPEHLRVMDFLILSGPHLSVGQVPSNSKIDGGDKGNQHIRDINVIICVHIVRVRQSRYTVHE